MIASKHGKIVNIGSMQSELARPEIAPRTSAKGAARNLTRGICTDWTRYGIQVNGYFKTPLNQALVDNPEFTVWLESQRRPCAGAMSRNLSGRRWFSPRTLRLSSTATFFMSIAASRHRLKP